MKANANRWKHTRHFLAVLTALLVAPSVRSLELKELSGPAHGYPELRELNGKALADGEFLQWVEDDRLHIKITQRFKGGGRTEENGCSGRSPRLCRKNGRGARARMAGWCANFESTSLPRTATAQKREKGELKHWEEKLEIEPGRTFAGFGFTVALQNLRQRLLKGEHIELKAVGFAPKPQLVAVELSHAGVDGIEMSGRSLRGDHFVIHPKIPSDREAVRQGPGHADLADPSDAGRLSPLGRTLC